MSRAREFISLCSIFEDSKFEVFKRGKLIFVQTFVPDTLSLLESSRFDSAPSSLTGASQIETPCPFNKVWDYMILHSASHVGQPNLSRGSR
jgi:hypothetical protein